MKGRDLKWRALRDSNSRPSGSKGEFSRYSKQHQPTRANEINKNSLALSVGLGWLCTQFTDTYTDTLAAQLKKGKRWPHPPREDIAAPLPRYSTYALTFRAGQVNSAWRNRIDVEPIVEGSF